MSRTAPSISHMETVTGAHHWAPDPQEPLLPSCSRPAPLRRNNPNNIVSLNNRPSFSSSHPYHILLRLLYIPRSISPHTLVDTCLLLQISLLATSPIMAGDSAAFKTAVEDSKKLVSKPTNDELLRLYGTPTTPPRIFNTCQLTFLLLRTALYKIANAEDITKAPAPGLFDLKASSLPLPREPPSNLPLWNAY